MKISLLTANQQVALMTEAGYILRFAASEIPEKKKTAVGVRGIRLQKSDRVEQVEVFEEGTDTKVLFHEKEVSLNRLKLVGRDGTGTKMRK